MTTIYVLSKDGCPLDPMHRYGRARRFLSSGKARIVRRVPFTIQLTYNIEKPVTKPYILSIDPGRDNIGLCAMDPEGKVVLASNIETRNKEVPRLMAKRKRHRQMSRRGERLRRRRRAAAISKEASVTEYWRMLPGCSQPVRCKTIRNTPARFNNRRCSAGWLTPTATHLLRTHLNAAKLIREILPVSSYAIEINRFDFQRMENPGIRNWQYQKGRLCGFKNVFEAAAYQQKGKCLLCGKSDIEHYHHIVPGSQGGSNTLNNIAGLCKNCHKKIHTDSTGRTKARLAAEKKGILKKYHALSILNQIIRPLTKQLSEDLPTYVTTGKETKTIREMYGLKKDHYIDAWCIGTGALGMYDITRPDFTDCVYNIRQFRRHNRAKINNQRERIYRLDGKTIAKNRRPRFEQKGPALSDLNLSLKETGRLKVIPSKRRYNNPDRVFPGTAFIHKNRRYVLSGQLSGGKYYNAVGQESKNFPAKDCRILTRNTGLVFIKKTKTAP